MISNEKLDKWQMMLYGEDGEDGPSDDWSISIIQQLIDEVRFLKNNFVSLMTLTAKQRDQLAEQCEKYDWCSLCDKHLPHSDTCPLQGLP